MITGILLVFAVLVLLYRRFISPLVNMGSLLLAPLGGLLALMLIGQPLSMPVFIGILMLLGIVAKNSILLIDFAIEEMEQGVPKLRRDHRRRAQARPADPDDHRGDGRGHDPDRASRCTGDGAWRAPMGTVVIGGLMLSTLLTLLIVPGGLQPRRRSREAARAVPAPPIPDLRARRCTATRPEPQPAE